MNTDFTEYTMNNTDNKEKSKIKKKCYKRTKQEPYLTIHYVRNSKVKKR